MIEIQGKVAYIFPGQGSQKIGMLAKIQPKYPVIDELFAEANDVLGYDLWQLIQDGPVEKLNKTEYTQPAMLVADYVAWQILQQQQTLPKPCYLAGHSLGEYAALTCANVISFRDAVLLVAKRGKLMQEAIAPGAGAMAAIVGLNSQQIQQICLDAAQNQILAPANFNALGQTVLAGEQEAVNRAVVLAEDSGAKLAKILPVSVPAHCSLMQPAATELANVLQEITFQSPKYPVLHNFDIKTHDDSSTIKNILIKQLTNPVRWVETLQFLQQQHITNLIECGPNRVLTRLVGRTIDNVTTYCFQDLIN